MRKLKVYTISRVWPPNGYVVKQDGKAIAEFSKQFDAESFIAMLGAVGEPVRKK